MKKQTGLTLIELLVTVAVAAILAALAVPSFNDFIKNERIVAEANDIVAALYLARTEALKRNRRVTVCPSADADAAAPSCTIDSAGNWSSGYIIFTDGNREAGTDANGVFEPAAPSNEVLIKAKGQIVGNLRLDATAADIRGYISFLPRGQPKTLRTGPLSPSGDPARSQSGALRLCDDRGDPGMRAITLSPTGRVRVLTGTAASSKTQTCPSI